MDLYNLGLDYLQHYRERLQEVTLASAREAARKHLQPDSLVALVVGPAAQCAGDLKGLGPLEIIG
jgi:zinc protease